MLLFTDGFDSMAAIADASAKGWGIANQGAGSWTFLAAGGVNGGGAIDCAQDDQGAIKLFRVPGNGINHVRFAGWFKSGGNPGATDKLIQIFDSFLVLYMHFSITTAGEIIVHTSNNATSGTVTLSTTIGAALHDGAYHFIEIYYLSDNDADGRVKIKVDNVTVMDVSGSNSQSNQAGLRLLNIDSLYLWTPDTNGTWDDIIIWDDVAGDGFTGELANPLVIATIRPDAAGDSSDLTVTGAATNREAVDEAGFNDADTTYVTGDAVGEKDLYNFAAISPTPSAIKAIAVNMVVRTEAGAQVGIKSVTKNGGVEADSETKLFSNVGYTTIQGFHSVDPNTAAAWTEAGLNTTQFGPEMVS